MWRIGSSLAGKAAFSASRSATTSSSVLAEPLLAAVAEIGLVALVQHGVNIEQCHAHDRRMDHRLRIAFDQARQRLAALAAEERGTIRIGLIEVKRDIAKLSDTRWPLSSSTGTVGEKPPPICADAGIGRRNLLEAQPLVRQRHDGFPAMRRKEILRVGTA